MAWSVSAGRLDADVAGLLTAVRGGKRAASPYHLLAVPCSAADQLACATTYIARTIPPVAPPLWAGERYSHERIRIAYLTSDLRHHAVASLVVGLFEAHDKTRFETTAIVFGPGDDSDIRRRALQSFDRVIDADAWSEQQIAETIRTLEIDIAVDLMGFTAGCRPVVLAQRPAPVQVNYLGYPGTMGVGFMDYLIADATALATSVRRAGMPDARPPAPVIAIDQASKLLVHNLMYIHQHLLL